MTCPVTFIHSENDGNVVGLCELNAYATMEHSSEALKYLCITKTPKKEDPYIANSLPHYVVDRLNRLIRWTPLDEAYTIDPHGVKKGVLINEKIKWSINPSYQALVLKIVRNYLESASIKTNTDKLFLDALIADRSIRMKQARGLKWFIFFSTTEKRAICYDWEHSDKQWDE